MLGTRLWWKLEFGVLLFRGLHLVALVAFGFYGAIVSTLGVSHAADASVQTPRLLAQERCTNARRSGNQFLFSTSDNVERGLIRCCAFSVQEDKSYRLSNPVALSRSSKMTCSDA